MAISAKGLIQNKSKVTRSVDGYAVKDMYGYRVDTMTAANMHATMASCVSDLAIVPGNSHPYYATSYCRVVEPIPIGAEEVNILCTYSSIKNQLTSEDDEIEVGASCSYQQRNKDKNNADIKVTYTYPTDTDKYGTWSGKSDTVVVPVQVYWPTYVFRHIQKENISPAAKARSYVGRLNSVVFKSGAIGTWMCKSILGRSNDGGANYIVTYEFEYRPAGWKETVFYIDKFTGRPPSNLISGIGVKDVQVYDSVSFAGLGL